MTGLLLHEAFFAAAAKRPAATAITVGEDSRTFGEVADAVPGYVRALAARKVGRGDRVGVWCDTELDLVPLYLACAALGATFTPANPRFSPGEANDVFELADPKLVVVDDDHEGDVRLRDLARATDSSGVDSEDPGEDDGHIMFFTSGTTGRPKAIELSHRDDMIRALSNFAVVAAGPTLSMFPLFHMSGWMAATVPWLRGEAVVQCDGVDAAGLMEATERHRVARFYAIPAVWSRILELDLSAFDLSSLVNADTGTSATTVRLLEGIHAALPNTVTTVTYGSTEAGSVCCLPFEDIAGKPGSVGPPVPGVRIRVDEYGQLWVRSPFLFSGYFRNPDATTAALVDGWYRTGELADVDQDGYVSIVGRSTEMIRTGGETVAPAEVDTVLIDHPAVADAAVAGVPDERWGEVVTAFVSVRPGERLTIEDLQRHCEGRIARFKVPRRLVLVDQIPRTGATRQVQRAVLTEMATAMRPPSSPEPVG